MLCVDRVWFSLFRVQLVHPWCCKRTYVCLLNSLAFLLYGPPYGSSGWVVGQHNRLCAHTMGLTFKMYCNDNVEDDTSSNCIERDGIQISLSRVLHLYGCTLWFGWFHGWLEVGVVGFPVGGWRWVWWVSLWVVGGGFGGLPCWWLEVGLVGVPVGSWKWVWWASLWVVGGWFGGLPCGRASPPVWTRGQWGPLWSRVHVVC